MASIARCSAQVYGLVLAERRSDASALGRCASRQARSTGMPRAAHAASAISTTDGCGASSVKPASKKTVRTAWALGSCVTIGMTNAFSNGRTVAGMAAPLRPTNSSTGWSGGARVRTWRAASALRRDVGDGPAAGDTIAGPRVDGGGGCVVHAIEKKWAPALATQLAREGRHHRRAMPSIARVGRGPDAADHRGAGGLGAGAGGGDKAAVCLRHVGAQAANAPVQRLPQVLPRQMLEAIGAEVEA